MTFSDQGKKLAAAGAIVLVAFAGGRFSVPEKVRVETKTVSVRTLSDEQKQAETQSASADRRHEVVVTQIVKPDGTRETTTRTIVDNRTERARAISNDVIKTDTVSKETVQVKEVTRGRGSLDIALLVGPAMSFSGGIGTVAYGVHVSRPLIGPLTMGLWGLSSGQAGVSVGLRF